jgi:ubiquinone/menaquinone biosynthesis methyltransferase
MSIAEDAQRETQVRSMFDRIAARYDLMNSVMSAGLHHRWRARAADLSGAGPGDRALDVCCGTGDLALELKRRVGGQGSVVGLDFSDPMLEIARHKAAESNLPVDYVHGNALELPFEDASFDAATVGFGIRNVVDLEAALVEMGRVVRPGGRIVILEITSPERPPLSWFFAIWFDRIVPLLGAVSGERDAYTYLPDSVRRFPPAAGLARLMTESGLGEVRYLVLAGGIVAIHTGSVESPRTAGEALVEDRAADSVDVVAGTRAPAVRALMERAERNLEAAVSGHGTELSEAACSTLAAGGKRLRPLLVLICGGVAEAEPLVRAAASVELVHMATLVHDDVLDRADLRRGRPTVYSSSGRGRATAVGDFLFSRAFALLAENGDPDQVRALSEACLALARGELEQRADAYSTDLGVERYLRRCELKTARLFSAACRLGGLAAGRSDDEIEALAAYGLKIGLAFQMLDDVLDVSSEARTGKRRGTDLLDGTVTFPLILARHEDPELAELDLRSLRTPEDTEAVCDRIAATGALERTRARAAELVEEGKAELSASVAEDLERPLEAIAAGVVERYS